MYLRSANLGKYFMTNHPNVANFFSKNVFRHKSSNIEGSRQVKTWKRILKYTTLGLGGVFLTVGLSGSLYIWYRWRRFQKKGFEMFCVKSLPQVPFFRYKDTVLPLTTVWRFEQYETLKVREDDIFLVSYPRSGTTWLQEIIYLIHSDLNFNTAKSKIMDERFPFLDAHLPGLKAIDAMTSPRLLKTHMPYRLLPLEVHEKKPKIVYICRNPKDVIVSVYYQLQSFSVPVPFGDLFQTFMDDELFYGPWWRHVMEFWDRRDDDNILFLTYEDMKQDTDACLHRIARFLDKDLTADSVAQIREHCSVTNMKTNRTTNFDWFDKNLTITLDRSKPGWIRKGQIGDWKNHFTAEMSQSVDLMLQQRFAGTGLVFRDKPQSRHQHEEQ